MDHPSVTEAHQEWQEQLARLADEQDPGWEARNQPGSFGCHELLDRANLIGDLVESQVLNHPACALREEWHRLALRAVDALRDLYQRVGGEHLLADGTNEPVNSANGAAALGRHDRP